MKLRDKAYQCIGMNEVDESFHVIIDGYNEIHPLPRAYRASYYDEWCAIFVSYCAHKIGIANFPFECSCEKMIEKLKTMELWEEDESIVPEPDDLIFYHWSDSGKGNCMGRANHVGIVKKVDNMLITVIEGNYNNAVRERQIPVNGRFIRGFGLTNKLTKSKLKKDDQVVAYEVIAGKWGNGVNRKNSLESEGYSYERIQSLVNTILNGVSNTSYGDVEDIAIAVIRGEYGGVAETTSRLFNLGYDVMEVMERVIEIQLKGGN